MRSERHLIALHEQMRKTAFERLSPVIVKALEPKTANEARKEAPDARTR